MEKEKLKEKDLKDVTGGLPPMREVDTETEVEPEKQEILVRDIRNKCHRP